jgi:hypothetical protein
MTQRNQGGSAGIIVSCRCFLEAGSTCSGVQHVVLAALYARAPRACLGKITAAAISGTVNDEIGAVLPNAEIVAANVETGMKRTILSP